MRYLYADTSVWNCMCDQGTDPQALTLALASHDVSLALGFNVLYEIAKQFFTGTEEAEGRGRELFAYLKHYLALRVPILKENWALLIEEAMDAAGDERMESCFRDGGHYQLTTNEIDKLCRGDVAPEVRRFFQSRKSEARTSRTTIKHHLEVRSDLKGHLGRISDDTLPEFLATASVGPPGQFLLLGHLCKEFPRNSQSDLADVAKVLLEFPRYRVSHAMTRADLYLNWRCVKRGSIRSDLPDDTFHVVSAAYCDFFATTEDDQADIACHAIKGIRAVVFKQGEGVSDKLVRDVERTIGTAPSV